MRINKAIVLFIIIYCSAGITHAALDGIRVLGDFERKYLADDVLAAVDGWSGSGVLGDAADDSGSQDFFKNAAGNLQYATRIIGGGVWQQQATSPSYFLDNVGAETSYTLEVSIKMEHPSSGLYESCIWVKNSNSQGLNLSIYDIGTSLSGDPETDNTDAFHVFRVAFDADADLFYVWRDGHLLGSTAAVNTGGGQRLIFGDPSSIVVSGQVEYEYIAIDAMGAYSPPADPYCGQPGTLYLRADLDRNCYVNLTDLMMIVQGWLECTDVFLEACQANL